LQRVPGLRNVPGIRNPQQQQEQKKKDGQERRRRGSLAPDLDNFGPDQRIGSSPTLQAPNLGSAPGLGRGPVNRVR
jgi:hypothetical protein